MFVFRSPTTAPELIAVLGEGKKYLVRVQQMRSSLLRNRRRRRRRQVGVRPSAIRYYEGQKILAPAVRGANGYMFYTDDAVKLLRFVRRAQALGITLKEIEPLLNLAVQGQRPCSHVKQLARNHLQEIDQKISALQKLRNELRTVLRRKAGGPHGNEICPIIERRAASNS